MDSDPKRVVRGEITIIPEARDGKLRSREVEWVRLQVHPDGVGPVEKWMARAVNGGLFHDPDDFEWCPKRFRIPDETGEFPFLMDDAAMWEEIAAALQKILGADHE